MEPGRREQPTACLHFPRARDFPFFFVCAKTTTKGRAEWNRQEDVQLRNIIPRRCRIKTSYAEWLERQHVIYVDVPPALGIPGGAKANHHPLPFFFFCSVSSSMFRRSLYRAVQPIQCFSFSPVLVPKTAAGRTPARSARVGAAHTRNGSQCPSVSTNYPPEAQRLYI